MDPSAIIKWPHIHGLDWQFFAGAFIIAFLVSYLNPKLYFQFIVWAVFGAYGVFLIGMKSELSQENVFYSLLAGAFLGAMVVARFAYIHWYFRQQPEK